MVAGLNLRVDVWRYKYRNDDAIGGAVVTGSVQFRSLSARLEAAEPTQAFLEQGLEVTHVFHALVIPGTLDVRERDEIEVVEPRDHFEYGNHFRIMGVQHSSHSTRDPRNYLILTVTRSERAHARQ